MSISGSDGESKIRGKVNELQSKQNSLSTQLTNYENKIDSLMNERERCLSNLALIYLPELDAKSVETTLKQVQAQVKDVFRQKQALRESLEGQMQSALNDKGLLESRLAVVTDQLNQKAEERDAIVEKVNAELAGRDEYPQLNATAEVKGKELAENKTTLEQFKADAKKKLEAYKSNELFMYLVNRQFGKPAPLYNHGRLVRNWDRAVARLVNFEENKKNYDFLMMMPELMDAELERRQSAYKEVASKVEAMVKEVQESYGLPKVMKEGASLGDEREKILQRIKQKEEAYQRCTQDRKELDTTKGEYYEKAVKRIKDFLKGDSIADLKRMAKETPDSRDDALVNRMEQIDTEVRNFKDNAKETIAARDAVSNKLDGLNSILNNYRSKDYEGSRSYFESGFDMDSLIAGYLLGRITNTSVWSQIEANQRFKPKPRPSYSYDSDSSSFGGFSSGFGGSSSHHSSSSSSSFGGFGGGSHSSGGGFGGGSFSSGSGF
ncbi:hypothetical protein HZA97_07690 [Candidatus Woesearchaeota archaeon]|nr:hypothetical protein [Candidatus Woesearchaeota archaeon]